MVTQSKPVTPAHPKIITQRDKDREFLREILPPGSQLTVVALGRDHDTAMMRYVVLASHRQGKILRLDGLLIRSEILSAPRLERGVLGTNPASVVGAISAGLYPRGFHCTGSSDYSDRNNWAPDRLACHSIEHSRGVDYSETIVHADRFNALDLQAA